jgi:hypothetical protein
MSNKINIEKIVYDTSEVAIKQTHIIWSMGKN